MWLLQSPTTDLFTVRRLLRKLYLETFHTNLNARIKTDVKRGGWRH